MVCAVVKEGSVDHFKFSGVYSAQWRLLLQIRQWQSGVA